MVRIAPISPLKLLRTGAFLAVRASPADGSCGVHSYPCKHPGADLAGARGTPVKAPEAGEVTVVADGASRPFQGYGPWLVMIRGDSGRYHLLSHLDRATNKVQVGQRVAAGEVVGTTSSANHTHWEVRRRPVPPAGTTNQQNNEDPVAWLRGGWGLAEVALAAIAGWGIWRVWRG